MLKVLICAALMSLLLGCKATHHIYLDKFKNLRYHSLSYDLKLRSANDSDFIKVEHRADMGHVYGVNYIFVKNIPDGLYKIFVDDTLKEATIYKSGNKNGKSCHYYPDGTYSISFYNNGSINGTSRIRDASGEIVQQNIFYNGELVLNSFYRSKKNVISHSFYVNNILMRSEISDTAKHYLTVTDKFHKLDNETMSPASNGKQKRVYIYPGGQFEVTYKGIVIVDCKFIPGNNAKPND